MKKLLLLIIVALCTITISAETSSYKAISFSLKENGTYSEWTKCDLTCILSDTYITIQSAETQMFYTQDAKFEYYVGFDKIIFYCIDVNGVKCHVEFYFYKDGRDYMAIKYSNCEYAYRVTSN